MHALESFVLQALADDDEPLYVAYHQVSRFVSWDVPLGEFLDTVREMMRRDEVRLGTRTVGRTNGRNSTKRPPTSKHGPRLRQTSGPCTTLWT
jgi:hypothetical protein